MFNTIKNFAMTYIVNPIRKAATSVFEAAKRAFNRAKSNPFSTVCGAIVIGCGFLVSAPVGLFTVAAMAGTSITAELLGLSDVARLVPQFTLLAASLIATAPSIIIPLCGASVGCAL